ncbi:class I SAM-dependent methyltransferase [Rhizobium rhizogenes]|uniref:class I SAM-dependent methyltransferase n=2 Tax=Rhizobium rhizogenes TaxID=359 RepID=UPI001573FE83|nr:class I SAM-dependent methyltransferase [Rhizobium rhizogenes]NTI31329.1 class I SAM-dependent methyltransferase [Rhizobium rhizogenes]
MTSPANSPDIIFSADKLRLFEAAMGGYHTDKLAELNICLAVAKTAHLKVNYLDVGTCTGRYPEAFSSLFSYSCAVDKSYDAVRLCKERYDHTNFRVLDVSIGSIALEFRRKFCFITMMMGTINHINRESHRKILKNMRDALDSHGCIVLSYLRRAPPYDVSYLYNRSELEYLLSNKIDSNVIEESKLKVDQSYTTEAFQILVLRHKMAGSPDCQAVTHLKA